MRSLINIACAVALLLVFGPGPARGAAESDEKFVWDAWKQHQGESNTHAAVIAACQQAQQACPTNPLLPVIQGLAGWHLLQLGKTNAAAAAFEALLAAPAASPLATAAAEMARRWLTRLDREQVRRALQLVYKRDIAYPPTLDALQKLPANQALPLKDRWNAPWKYGLVEFKRIKGVSGQAYTLESSTLGAAGSDLAGALKQPPLARIPLKPIAAASGTVTFKTTGDSPQKVMLSEGAQTENVTLAYLGAKIMILTDGDFWLVLPNPK